MSQDTNKLKPTKAPKTGFFTRILNKVDSAMKEKAEANAKNSQCCSPNKNGKGGGCC